MKSRKEMRNPAKDVFAGSEELKKARKLKPVKKEKNPKRTLYEEIDDLDDLEMNFVGEELDDEMLFDDGDEDDH
jgi:hypothetical protein